VRGTSPSFDPAAGKVIDNGRAECRNDERDSGRRQQEVQCEIFESIEGMATNK
jgi:hypothetical protein